MSDLDSKTVELAEKVAIEAAKETGKNLIKKFDQKEIVSFKDRQDICTNMDIESEKLIVSKIREAFPEHSIFSEEMGKDDKECDYRWIIDPIDGSKYYMRNIPLFTVSIALGFKGEVVMGVVYNPSTGRMYHAHKGGGAFLNGNKIRVSDVDKLEEAMVVVDITKMHTLQEEDVGTALSRLNELIMKSYRTRSFGLGSIELSYLAGGGFDAYFDLSGKTKFIDIAAGVAIVREAGGKATDLNGEPITSESNFFVVSNGRIHSKILKLLNKV